MPNRATGIRTNRERDAPRRDGCRRPPARAARCSRAVPGVEHGSVRRVFIRRAHGEFIAVVLADDDGASRFQALDNGGVVGRDELVENARRGRGPHSPHAQIVFDGYGYTSQRPQVVATGPGRIHCGSAGERPLGIDGDERVQCGLEGLGAIERFTADVDGRALTAGHIAADCRR